MEIPENIRLLISEPREINMLEQETIGLWLSDFSNDYAKSRELNYHLKILPMLHTALTLSQLRPVVFEFMKARGFFIDDVVLAELAPLREWRGAIAEAVKHSECRGCVTAECFAANFAIFAEIFRISSALYGYNIVVQGISFTSQLGLFLKTETYPYTS